MQAPNNPNCTIDKWLNQQLRYVNVVHLYFSRHVQPKRPLSRLDFLIDPDTFLRLILPVYRN